jgi:hypothetical protein
MKTGNNNSFRRGQSIIEAIVAVSILTTGFLGITALLTKSFQLNRTVSDETKATYLAAENIEVVKSLIDHDVYSGIAFGTSNWGHCFGGGSGGYFEIDYETTDCGAMNLTNTTTTYPIYFNPTTGLYSYQAVGGQSTIFSRSTLVTVPNSNEIDVQSTVYWSPSPGLNQSLMLEDHFYNWNPN